MRTVNLPNLDSEIAQEPEFQAPLPGHRKRLHLSKVGGGVVGKSYKGSWEWAVLLHAVSGWEIIAHGTNVNTGTPKTHAEVWDMIAEQCYGENGDGYDRLPDHHYTQTKTGIAHIRHPSDVALVYCGQMAGPPAIFDTKAPDHARQICIACDVAYRAHNWGRTPVQA